MKSLNYFYGTIVHIVGRFWQNEAAAALLPLISYFEERHLQQQSCGSQCRGQDVCRLWSCQRCW